MKRYVALLLSAFLWVSCKTKERVLYVSDEAKTEVRYETVYIPDTAYIEIPYQVSEHTTLDTVSELKTQYAYSKARIFADGSLYHILENIPQTVAAETQKEIVYRDSIVERVKETETRIEVEVERRLSWWQRLRITAFWYLLGAVLLLAAWVWRKRLLKLIGR